MKENNWGRMRDSRIDKTQWGINTTGVRLPTAPIIAIKDFLKVSFIEYPPYISCVIFFQGCNLNCEYCYNKDLIKTVDKLDDKYIQTYEALINYLNYAYNRSKFIDAVVLTGGEPTIQPGIISFIQFLLNTYPGLKIKLHTNTTQFKIIKHLIDNNLIHSITTDIKSDKTSYLNIAKKIIDYISHNIIKNPEITWTVRIPNILNKIKIYDKLLSHNLKKIPSIEYYNIY